MPVGRQPGEFGLYRREKADQVTRAGSGESGIVVRDKARPKNELF